MQYVSVRSVASRMKSQFKVDMDIFDVVQACGDALKKMGLLALTRGVYLAQVQNFCVNLPGTVWKVRGAVRLDGLPDPPVTITVQDVYFPPQIVFVTDEVNETVSEPILFKNNYVPQFKGPYIDYVWDCPCMKFNETDVPVAIEFTGLKLDEEGFPMIPEDAFYGCLYYALFAYYQPLFLLGQVDDRVMTRVEQWKNQNVLQANAAVILQSLSSNEKDHLFDIMSSFDRKSFGKPV